MPNGTKLRKEANGASYYLLLLSEVCPADPGKEAGMSEQGNSEWRKNEKKRTDYNIALILLRVPSRMMSGVSVLFGLYD